jgi:hypothetical protein
VLWNNAKSSAKLLNKAVAHGTFMKIFKQTEEKYMLETGTIKFETIRSRILSQNLTAYCPQKVSPITEVEPLIINCCIRLSKMGESLTKFEVMEVANEIQIYTVHAERLKEFCEKRNIKEDFSKGKIVGTRWYSNFIKRHGNKLKTRPCRMQDGNRLTWCMLENFSNMYDAVYKAMVEVGVAINMIRKLCLTVMEK